MFNLLLAGFCSFKLWSCCLWPCFFPYSQQLKFCTLQRKQCFSYVQVQSGVWCSEVSADFCAAVLSFSVTFHAQNQLLHYVVGLIAFDAVPSSREANKPMHCRHSSVWYCRHGNLLGYLIPIYQCNFLALCWSNNFYFCWQGLWIVVIPDKWLRRAKSQRKSLVTSIGAGLLSCFHDTFKLHHFFLYLSA